MIFNIAGGGGGGDIPDAPSTNGTYILQVTVQNGQPTYSWEQVASYYTGSSFPDSTLGSEGDIYLKEVQS